MQMWGGWAGKGRGEERSPYGLTNLVEWPTGNENGRYYVTHCPLFFQRFNIKKEEEEEACPGGAQVRAPRPLIYLCRTIYDPKRDDKRQSMRLYIHSRSGYAFLL